MQIRKGQLPILIFNHEFILYVGVIIFFLVVFIYTNSKVYYPNALLWGLSIWAFMHLSGGAIYVYEAKAI